MKITYWLRDDGACGYYRASLPLQALAEHDDTLKIKKIVQGMHVDKISACLDADIQLIPRVGDDNIVDLMTELKKEGQLFVIDYDDNVFNVSPLSPHYVDYGTEEVRIPIGDSIRDLWIDGVNIDLKKNKLRRDMTIRAIEVADLITVTTDILADAYRKYTDNVAVLPNCIDLSIWQKLPMQNDSIRLFWQGGWSHYEDWYEIKDAVRIVMNKYPQCKLVLMGFKWDYLLEGIDKDQIEYHEWVVTPAYPYKVTILNPDIALIPLRDTEFNRCKSPIKWIEQSALSVPSVTSHVSPYADIATEHNGVFIENNDTGAWVAGISMLIEDSILRAKIGGEANRYVRQNFDINRRWVDWKLAYEGVLNGIPCGSLT